IAWVARRAGFRTQGGKSSALLTVKCSQSLGQRERVVIVEADDKWFLLGVTPKNINCLATLNKQSDSDEVTSSPLSGEFQNVLLNMLKKRKPESPQ
ncbi:MAG: flagellar biosynthetic protein FliO, partial [Acinetobacter sp.]